MERVLPKPEEPISKDVDNSDTGTFINDKLQSHTPDAKDKDEKPVEAKAGTEKVIGDDKKADKSKDIPVASADGHDHQVIKAKPQDDEQSETYVAHKLVPKTDRTNERAVLPADKPIEKVISHDDEEGAAVVKTEAPKVDKVKEEAAAKVEKAKAEAELLEKAKAEKVRDEKLKAEIVKAEKAKEEAAKADKAKEEAAAKAEKAREEHSAKASKAGGVSVVQLGAYRSEGEANEAWEKMHVKFKELSDKSPVIVKADLGEKGIYYRLRVGGLESPTEAKSLCKALSSKGQVCILPTEK